MKRVLTTLTLVVALVAFSGVGPARADSPAASDTNAVHYYLSLGDSLAAGDQPNGDFTHSYTDQLFADLKADDPTLRHVKRGCGGETTRTVIFRNPCGYPHGSQLAEAVAFLHAHRQFVSLVTIDIGGNDIGLCIFNLDQDCLDDGIAAIEQNLPVILSALRSAAGPDVPIVGMNYYNPFLVFWFESPPIAEAMNQMMVGQVNPALEAAYAEAGDPVADVETAFSTTDWTLEGDVPLNVLRICQWTWMCTNFDVHANTAGYGVIAQAFLDVIQP
jgi:lysophospholipase L1-like esterase